MEHPMQKYTSIQPVVMEGFPDAHNVFLHSTNQRFCVTMHGCDTKEDAEWTRNMLYRPLRRIALQKIVDENRAVEEAAT